MRAFLVITFCFIAFTTMSYSEELTTLNLKGNGTVEKMARSLLADKYDGATWTNSKVDYIAYHRGSGDLRDYHRDSCPEFSIYKNAEMKTEKLLACKTVEEFLGYVNEGTYPAMTYMKDSY